MIGQGLLNIMKSFKEKAPPPTKYDDACNKIVSYCKGDEDICSVLDALDDVASFDFNIISVPEFWDRMQDALSERNIEISEEYLDALKEEMQPRFRASNSRIISHSHEPGQ